MAENVSEPASPVAEPPKETAVKEIAEPAPTEQAKVVVWPPHRPVRTFFAAIFGIIALLLILATILVVWFNRTVTDNETYVRTVAPLAQRQEIRNFVGDQVTEGIVKGTELKAEVIGVVPPAEAEGKDADELMAAAKATIRKNVLQVIESPKFQSLWYETNKSAHDRLMTQLASNRKEVVLDLTPLTDGVLQELRATQLAPLAEKIVLPPDAGKVNLSGIAIDKISQYYNRLQTATLALVAAAVVAAGICILLSTHHVRTIRRILMGTGIMSLVLALLLQLPSWVKVDVAGSAQTVAVAVGEVLFHDLKLILLAIGVTSIVLAIVSKIISVKRRKTPRAKTLAATKS